jgi:alanyl-tRNA synthetase
MEKKQVKTRQELIKKYIDFFKSKNHKEIPSSSLIPSNDPTVLFTTAGMHPLVPFLLGEKHPLGKRLVDVQKCIRTGDIEEVGDEVHHTFFEMLGNWSIGDYFKKEAIEMSFEFITKILKIPLERFAVTVFEGDKDAPKDEEAAKIWMNLGISKERIAFLPKKDNWWGPAGETGPCGPDTEMFYWRDNQEKAPKKFNPEDKRWVEIWNDVLMQYNKDKRVILVDGMHCIYDKEFIINKELLEWLTHLNTHTILTVAGFREKGLELLKNASKGKESNWQAFSLEEKNINKTKKEFFIQLLERFNLRKEEVIYFDHSKENVIAAESAGILSKHYTGIESIKEFVEKNLFGFLSAKQKNIDTGMGVERTLAVLNGFDDNYLTEIWQPIIKEIEKLSKRQYGKDEDETRAIRIIADHIKASIFILADNVTPSNTERGYVLRRLIRRAIRYGHFLGIKDNFTAKLVDPVTIIYEKDYPELKKNRNQILTELDKEERRFQATIEQGLKEAEKIFSTKTPVSEEKFSKLMKDPNKANIIGRALDLRREGRNFSIKEPKITQEEIEKATINGNETFLLYQSYGFPLEMIDELAMAKGLFLSHQDFRNELKKHQELSKTASQGQFKSGLADNTQETTKLHTAAHLLDEALREVLKDENIKQKGSNITSERLRFDFNFPRKLTLEELKEIEKWVNDKINKKIPVEREEMDFKKAVELGAGYLNQTKYPEKVCVYTIGNKKEIASKEICTGPHVKNTGELGKFKILKEESSASGIRRIKAALDSD